MRNLRFMLEKDSPSESRPLPLVPYETDEPALLTILGDVHRKSLKRRDDRWVYPFSCELDFPSQELTIGSCGELIDSDKNPIIGYDEWMIRNMGDGRQLYLPFNRHIEEIRMRVIEIPEDVALVHQRYSID